MKNNIKSLRRVKGISQETLAKEIKISRPHLSDIENNKTNTTMKVMFKVANYFGKSTNEIFFDDNVVSEQHPAESNHLEK